MTIKPKMHAKRAIQHRRAPARKRQATSRAALMRIPAPPSQPWNLTLDEVALVRNHIAKGASDTELQFCLAVARRHKLDPFRGQIWFIKRKDDSAEGGYRWIPITGINGMLHIAARDHKDFGSNDEPEFGPMQTVKFRWNGQGIEKTIQAPEWAKITLWKKGLEHPIVARVFWSEIYPNIDYAPLVRQMPRLMLGKCALAQAVRRAYPATDGLYIKEEFQGPPELTPGGRVMTLTQSAEQSEFWCIKHNCDISKCPSDGHTNAENEEAVRLMQQRKLNPAQREIAKNKMAEAKSSQATQPAERPGAVSLKGAAAPACLHYELMPSGMYFIDGPEEIKHANRDLLAPLYVHPTGIMASAAQLGRLISQFEQRKIGFRDMGPPGREAGE